MTVITDKRVLITGGCGSIGSSLTRRCIDAGADLVRILDHNEQAIHESKTRLGHEDMVDFSIGDVQNPRDLKVIMRDIDIVLHTAALKHVGLAEQNPFQAVRTNVVGTRNVVWTASEADVDTLVGISTDKASNPYSAMGATKLLAERLVTASDGYSETTMACVRFGNIVGTRGSVVPIFMDKIREGQPLPVTDPDMTRFVMSPQEAAEFVLKACGLISGGEVLVKEMPAVRLGDLANAMIEAFAPRFGHTPDEVGIDLIGPRPGERFHEKLVSEDEAKFAVDRGNHVILRTIPDEIKEVLGDDDLTYEGGFTSKDADHLTEEEIISLLKKAL